MSKFIDPETDHHVGPSCHTGMNGILSQEETECGIIGIRRYTSYGVTWIDVFKAVFRALFFEIGLNPILQEDPDVLKADIAGGVPLSAVPLPPIPDCSQLP